MIDIKLIRENPDLVRNNLKKRNMQDKVSWVDDVVKNDIRWRELKAQSDMLRSRRNSISEDINKAKKEGRDISKLVKEAKDIPVRLKTVEDEMNLLQETIRHHLMSLPNILHQSVPLGKTEADNVTVRTVGKKTKHTFDPKSHVDLIKDLDLADLERAAKISGARFYYLKNQLVILNLAIQRFALDFLIKKGFTPVIPPYMMKREAAEGVVSFGTFEEMIYKMEDEDLYLIGTSEHPLTAMHMAEVLDADQLPLRYAGISPCFRKEAGAHGKDTKGIFRVHQFDKVEQIVFCHPKESWKWHEQLLKNAEEFMKLLKLSYRVVNLCSGDIGQAAAKTYDIEVWMPAQNAYRELISCSNCTNWQSLRLNMKYVKGTERDYLHTLNSTLVPNPRAIVAILENFQKRDGSIDIPRALWKYTGFKVIKPQVIKASKKKRK